MYRFCQTPEEQILITKHQPSVSLTRSKSNNMRPFWRALWQEQKKWLGLLICGIASPSWTTLLNWMDISAHLYMRIKWQPQHPGFSDSSLHFWLWVQMLATLTGTTAAVVVQLETSNTSAFKWAFAIHASLLTTSVVVQALVHVCRFHNDRTWLGRNRRLIYGGVTTQMFDREITRQTCLGNKYFVFLFVQDGRHCKWCLNMPIKTPQENVSVAEFRTWLKSLPHRQFFLNNSLSFNCGKLFEDPITEERRTTMRTSCNSTLFRNTIFWSATSWQKKNILNLDMPAEWLTFSSCLSFKTREQK